MNAIWDKKKLDSNKMIEIQKESQTKMKLEIKNTVIY